MSFDSHSLERLRELGRKLPKELPVPELSSPKKSDKKKVLHPIETETNPQVLFHELIEASSDGTVPQHLINRLKDAELSQTSQDSFPKINQQKKQETSNTSELPPINSDAPNKDLYLDFRQLLQDDCEAL